MLTDLYQLTMAYGYWKKGKDKDQAVFDLFFRKNPFGGEFTIFAGLEEVVRSLNAFKFTDADIAYLRDGIIRKKEELQLDFEDGLEDMVSSERHPDGFEELRYDPWGAESWEPKEYPEHDLLHTRPHA